MTAPDFGPCRCGPTHEHSDFEPYACADCGCGAHTAAAIPGAQSNADGQTPPSAGKRPHLTIPADLGFAQERVTQTAQWLDQVTAGIRETHPTAADDPLAVCALADALEQHGKTAGIDPWDVVSLLIRRQHAPSRLTRGILRRATDNIRRRR